jgi:hypothetical protein
VFSCFLNVIEGALLCPATRHHPLAVKDLHGWLDMATRYTKTPMSKFFFLCSKIGFIQHILNFCRNPQHKACRRCPQRHSQDHVHFKHQHLGLCALCKNVPATQLNQVISLTKQNQSFYMPIYFLILISTNIIPSDKHSVI